MVLFVGGAIASADAPEQDAAEPTVTSEPDTETTPIKDAPQASPPTAAEADTPELLPSDTVALPDRWRIGWPLWDRYGRQAPSDPLWMNAQGSDVPFTRSHPANPYDRNPLKGDYPIARTGAGDEIFFNLTAISDTLYVERKLPTPSGVSAADSEQFDIFGDGRQTFVSQTLLMSFEWFQGSTAFRPVDWLIRITPVYNFNYLKLREFNNTNIDVRKGDSRRDDLFSLQEAFFEYHLGDTSQEFDIAAVRIGRQLFVSDFRGFIFNDVTDGVRLFGNLKSNRVQYNLAFFNQNEKDTNSELNELNWRDQQLLIANVFCQDFIWKGYTTQASFHWNHDTSDREFDENGFQVIPDLAGSATLRDLDAYYLGWTGDGHIGRLNVNHAFYHVFGRDDANPIAGRGVDIDAFMAALELSLDMDWLRPKVSFLYASGDDNPEDGTAEGFDGILDNPFFAGGTSSFFQSVPLRIFGVGLTNGRSLFNDLSSSKTEGVANYVNPGTILLGAGFDAELTPKLRASFNANSIWMAQTETLELFLNQNDVDPHLGVEVNLTTQYRPLLNNNVILTLGGSLFFPGEGFGDIYEDRDTLWQFFSGVTLTY